MPEKEMAGREGSAETLLPKSERQRPTKKPRAPKPAKVVKLAKRPGPGKGVPHPTRERLRKQVTIRLDEDLLKIAQRIADDEGVRITELMERGLLDYMQRKKPGETPHRGRFLWTVMPLRLQRVVLGFMAYVSRPREGAAEEYFRNMMEEFCWKYRDTPEYQADLKRLGELTAPPQEED